MKKGMTLTVVLLIAAAVLAVVGFAQKGDVQKLLDAEVAKTEKLTAAAEGVPAQIEEAVNNAKAEAETAFASVKEELEAKVAELSASAEGVPAQIEEAVNNAKAEAETAFAATRSELEAQVAELTASAEGTPAALEAAIEAAKAEAEAAFALTKGELEAKVAELSTSLEAASVPAVVKSGLGMVTHVTRVANATAEKSGSAQVETYVATLVKDGEDKIISVTWDVQQTMINVDAEGQVTVPDAFQTKVEKGDAYGMIKASSIGKEWYEQMAAFEAYCVGKTVEEVLATPLDDQGVATGEDVKASTTFGLGTYLEALKKADEAAK